MTELTCFKAYDIRGKLGTELNEEIAYKIGRAYGQIYQPKTVVIGCDTVVDVKGEVFGKPHSPADAKRMLRALSGATHEVHTGVCISDGERTESFVDTCRVKFFSIPEAEIERYAATEEPYDKAGAYAIQGRAALWLDAIEGDYYTIMGLPVSRTIRLLQQF